MMKQITMTAIMATIATQKYCSTVEGGVSVGDGVASTSSTANAVVACDGQ